MFIEDIFKERISSTLLHKISPLNDDNYYFCRGVLESIRILEGIKAAPSSFAMNMKPRKLKGVLSDYWHVHTSENFLARTHNNLKSDSYMHPIKNPTPEELIERATLLSLDKYAKNHGIVCVKKDKASLVFAIKNKEEKRLGRTLSEKEAWFLTQKVTAEVLFDVQRIYRKPNHSSGDWLIFFKDVNDINYYLDSVPHIESSDVNSQEKLAISLNISRTQMMI